jgi:hypothetical protein
VTNQIELENRAAKDRIVKDSEVITLVPLPVTGQCRIADSLKLFYSEKMTYKADGCDDVIEVTRINVIVKVFLYLIIQLKGFTYLIETKTRGKIDQEYAFKEVIDLNDHVSKNQESSHRLSWVIVHQGDADTGHDLSYVHHDDDWMCLNDNRVNIVKMAIRRNNTNGRRRSSSDVGAFPISRKTKPYEGAREQFSLMLLIKGFYANLSRPLARFLASAEILAQSAKIFFRIESTVRNPDTWETYCIPI